MQSGDRPRHADRLVAKLVDVAPEDVPSAVRARSKDIVHPHVRFSQRADPGAEVQVCILTRTRHIDRHPAKPANAAVQRISHPLNECCRHRRVNRVTTGPQHFNPHLGGPRLRRHYHAFQSCRSFSIPSHHQIAE